jgi:hypothetical protein
MFFETFQIQKYKLSVPIKGKLIIIKEKTGQFFKELNK